MKEVENKQAFYNNGIYFNWKIHLMVPRINLNYVDSFTPLAVTMTDGCKIPLSRKKQTIFQERFNNLIRGTIK